VFSLLLSGRPPTASKLLPDSLTNQDVVVNVPHPIGVKFLFCKLLHVLDFDQSSVVPAGLGRDYDCAFCNCLSARLTRSVCSQAVLPEIGPEIGDMMAFQAPDTPDRFVTCHL